jgi:hypothetical protein
MKKLLLTFILSLSLLSSNLIELNYDEDLRFPFETKEKIILLNSLIDFINHHSENEVAFTPLEDKFLTDELIGITYNKKDSLEYKPYLNNIIRISDSTYFLQLSFLNSKNDIPKLRALYQFYATKDDEGFRFESTLKNKLKLWKEEIIDNIKFIYQDTLNINKAKEYSDYSKLYSEKLELESKQKTIICCNNLTEAQQLYGLLYRSDYNGRNSAVISVISDEKDMLIYGNNNANFNHFDPHDLWHSKLRQKNPSKKFYKSLDEGCAYFYGGSWGYSWDEIYSVFKDSVIKENNDWLDLKETPVYFKTGRYSNNADYIINALIVKELELKQGFSAVWEALDNTTNIEQYFFYLDKYLGINEDNYNEKINELLN